MDGKLLRCLRLVVRELVICCLLKNALGEAMRLGEMKVVALGFSLSLLLFDLLKRIKGRGNFEAGLFFLAKLGGSLVAARVLLGEVKPIALARKDLKVTLKLYLPKLLEQRLGNPVCAKVLSVPLVDLLFFLLLGADLGPNLERDSLRLCVELVLDSGA